MWTSAKARAFYKQPGVRGTSAGVLFCLAIRAFYAQTPEAATTIRVPVRLIVAPALVFSKQGSLIPNLQLRDFRMYDNNRLQRAQLDTPDAPVSVVFAIQTNQDVRAYLPFISPAGASMEALLVGMTGRASVLAYDDRVSVLKTFERGDLRTILRGIQANGREARAIDAGRKAVDLLKLEPKDRARVLLFIGQAQDTGSESSLAALREEAENENVTVFALTLPEFGRAFVSDTFSLNGADKGGYRAGVDLHKLLSALNHNRRAENGADPFSVLASATGGTQLPFRRQREFEGALATLGVALRSEYSLSYSPNATEPGYHSIRVEVDIPGAKVFTRPGYRMAAN